MDPVTHERMNEIAFDLLISELSEVSRAELPDALKVIEDGLVSRSICTKEEAAAMTQRIQALRFSQQYPPQVLEHIHLLRAHEIGSSFPH